MIAPEKFVLTPQERDSVLWRRLKQQFALMLQTRRESNDTPFDPIVTASLRGEITILKYLLDLETDRASR
jgi:hypothetical protein